MKHILSVMIVSALLVSCGGSNEGIVQKNEQAQIKFVGNILQSSASIDDGEVFTIEKADVVYTLKPGTHVVKVFKSNQLVVNRSVFIENGVTMEIAIP